MQSLSSRAPRGSRASRFWSLRWMAIFALIATLLITTADYAGASHNLLANGSFDSQFTANDWTVTSGNIDRVTGWDTPDGSHIVDLNGEDPGEISQTFSTVDGANYDVSFQLAGNPDCGGGDRDVRVTVGNYSGDFNFDSTNHTFASLGWVPRNFSFTAGTGGSSTLTFKSLTNPTDDRCGVVLDLVNVTGPNHAPTLTIDTTSVTVNEGATAVNGGTYSDSDGDVVTITATVDRGAGPVSIGTVSQAGSAWSWSFGTADGPADSITPVTITATDSAAATATATFGLTVNNVAPELEIFDSNTDNTVYYVNWTSADAAGGTATGTITLPEGPAVQVTFEAVNPNGTPSSFNGTETKVNGGYNWWADGRNDPDTYVSTQVPNAPPDSDIIALGGEGSSTIYRVTLDSVVVDPIMAILSLGNPPDSEFPRSTTYDFDTPFEIVSQGKGPWGGGATSLVHDPVAHTLVGREGNGTIKFLGDYNTFSWTVPSGENWHGFQFGIRTSKAIAQTVTVDEGQTAATNGTWSDVSGDSDLALSASIGIVTKDANGAGTWNWTFDTTDGPAQSGLVTITADDGENNGSTEREFNLVVNNVDPVVTGISGPSVNNEGSIGNYTVSFTDPAGTIDAHTIVWDCGDAGVFNDGTGLSTTCFFPDEGSGTRVIQAKVTDKDGGSDTGSKTVTLNNVAPVVLFDFTTALFSGNGVLGDLDLVTETSWFDGVAWTPWSPAHISEKHNAWWLIPGTNYIFCDADWADSCGIDKTSKYRAAFELPTGFSNASVSVNAYADNSAKVYVNGYQIGSVPGFTGTPTPMSSDGSTPFHDGTNYIEFHLKDTGGVAGLDYRAEVSFDHTSAGTIIDEGGEVTVTGTYSDLGTADTHTTASINWGDGTATASLSLTPGQAGTGTFTATHTYLDNNHGTSSSTHPVTVKVHDNDSGIGEATADVTVNNVAPAVSADNASVTVNEDELATNTGLFEDIVDEVVSVSANVGTVSFTPNTNEGTWSWSYGTTDGPDNGGTITITATDADGGSNQTTFSLTVNNLAPTIALSVVGDIDEGTEFTLNLDGITDPGSNPGDDSVFSYDIDWGDGNTQTFTGSPQNTTQTHTYADGLEDWTISVDLEDEDGTYLNAGELDVTVNNLAPTIALSVVGDIDEGTEFTLNLDGITDPGDDSVFSYDIDWGDGNTQTFTGSPQNTTQTHTYADGLEDWTISVDLEDEDGTYLNAGELDVTVNNVAPVLGVIDDVQIIYGHTAAFSVDFTDVGVPDTHTATVSWSTGAAFVAAGMDQGAGSGTVSASSNPFLTLGLHTVTVRLSDDNGGTDSATFTVEVLGGKGLKGRAKEILLPFIDVSKHIEKAIKEIDKSLVDDLWVSELLLEEKHGKKVFDHEKHAVKELMHLPNHGIYLEAAELAIADLLAADKLLAEIQIRAAEQALQTTDPSNRDKVAKELDKSYKEIDKVARELAKGHPDHAIDKYKAAWLHATHALKAAAKAPKAPKAKGPKGK